MTNIRICQWKDGMHRVRKDFRDLTQDPYVAEGFRRKHIVRYRVLKKSDGCPSRTELLELPQQPLFQGKRFNPVHGGIHRAYPLFTPNLHSMMIIKEFVKQTRVQEGACILVQAQRITCTSSQEGQPSVENWHQDDVDEVGILCVTRKNIVGGDARAPKVIVTCFAGRQGYLSILYEYLAILVRDGLVHEVHLWNYTRDEQDEIWIRSGRFNKYNLPQFTVKEPPSKGDWSNYYQYYAANQDALFDDDVLIKLDDDVVYIDVAGFAAFIDRRRKEKNHLFAFPNIINNGVCAYYQTMYGFTAGYFEPDELPYDTFYGRVVTDGVLAKRLHEMFLSNVQGFTSRARSLAQPVVVHKMGDRISINFFAVLGKDIGVFADIVSDDEHECTVELTKKHSRQHYIDMSLVIAVNVSALRMATVKNTMENIPHSVF
ncbi:hypothetical protein TSOC_002728 [Tetrabaena socialis]|uniref:Uncharacterized protein n=1 Tax=Tetrabaena socialis TaxID=47790 RepID=A0A2J8ADE4_9CHLO|nr:hypothetical protein TSOC_002728 [Tetrabaena socialis]|eukprot:PNH10540.1 hypothetical protein TSOC_002728 [Tetrabaena socialis]